MKTTDLVHKWAGFLKDTDPQLQVHSSDRKVQMKCP